MVRGTSQLSATHLRTEYLVDPIGVDCAAPRLRWEVACADPSLRGVRQSACRIVVRGPSGKTVWDSGKIPSNGSPCTEYAGKPLAALCGYRWRVRVWDEKGSASPWSAQAGWTMGPAAAGPRGWRACAWVGPLIDPDWKELAAQPSSLIRKSFVVEKPVERAVLYASALGVYEARMNGKRVGDALLSPEWTDYRTRVQYQGYDVTALIQPGENVMGAMLGPGWYAGQLGAAGHIQGISRGVYGRALRFIALLLLRFAGGEQSVILTDASWRCTTEGPIRGSDILAGETYDARRELPGWDMAGFNDSAWLPVSISRGPALCAQPNEPIRLTEIRPAISLSEPVPGTFIYDMGQNMVGWVRARLRGQAGDDIRLRHAEMLCPDGTLYLDNLRMEPARPLRGAAQEDHYICRGAGEEIFQPRFTYHGFRYVEVTGVRGRPSLPDIEGCVIHSDAPRVGELACSDPAVNSILSAIQWTQRGNMHGIPTDCPQRDERLGWAGDIQVFSPTAMFNRDMAAFLSKWLRDMRDAQTPDGRFPDFAPHPYGPLIRYSGNPGWADAGVIVPWRLYLFYGDRRILDEAFESACCWVDFGVSENTDLIWRDHGKLEPLYYGDWLNADTFVEIPGLPRSGAEVPKEVYATAFFAYSAGLVARMARVLGRTREARIYGGLSQRIRAAFIREFVSPQGKIRGDTQAGYALALHFDLLPVSLRKKAAQRMVAALKPYGGGLSTGIQSTLRLMLELARWGHLEEAYRILGRHQMPSWLYMIEHGGTTMWERWDGWVEGRGFQNPGMNSFNHYAIGSVGEWIWRVIAGINPDETNPGCAALRIEPRPGCGLTWARASWHTVRGTVTVAWRIDDSRFHLEVSLPPSVNATVIFPCRSLRSVTEGGLPADQARCVRALRKQPRGCAVSVESGNYRFIVESHNIH